MIKTMDMIVPYTSRFPFSEDVLRFVIKRLRSIHGIGKIYIVITGKHMAIPFFEENGIEVVYLAGTPNKAWAMNHAFENLIDEVAAVCDADLMIHLDSIHLAIKAFNEGFNGGKLCPGFMDASVEATFNILKLDPTHNITFAHYVKHGLLGRRGGNKFAGAFWLSKNIWKTARGFNELFAVAGSEDIEMALKTNTIMSHKEWKSVGFDLEAIHLAHPHFAVQRNWSDEVIYALEKLSHIGVMNYIEKLPWPVGCSEGPRMRWPEDFKGEILDFEPLDFSDFDIFSLDLDTMEWIFKLIPRGKTIVELGSGKASRELAKFYKVYSIENNPEYLNKYEGVNYIHAPLIPCKLPYEWAEEEQKDHPDQRMWYDPEAIRGKLPEHYDMLIVDGPADSRQRLGLLNHLDLFDIRNPVILFDDASRKAEGNMFADIATKSGRPSLLKKSQYSNKSFGLIGEV